MKKRGVTTDRLRAERKMTQNAMRGCMTLEQWRELDRITWERGRREEAELIGDAYGKEEDARPDQL